jgi:N-acetylglucosaminyl-diphospho-decaprenol L-rhamnosyltransferase
LIETLSPAGTKPAPRDGLTSIVVVAADSGPLLGNCVDAALASTATVELVLVDNASSDGEIERVAARHRDDVRLSVFRNMQNLGFGPAVNLGARHARGDVLLVLNPDCQLQAPTVERMRSLLAADTRIGLLGVNVCSPDGRSARGNRRRDPTLRRAALEMSGVARWERRFPSLAGVEVRAPADGAREPEEVEAVSGACMMLPRETFDRLQGFDEAYFLHVEDLDLCRRVRDAGQRVAIANTIDVVHAQGSSSRKRPLFVMLHKHRGMWRYFNKFDPAARNPLWRAVVALGLTAHAAAAAIVYGARRLSFRNG